MSDPEHRRTGRLGGLTGWNQTHNRDARMAHVRAGSPADDGYHAKKLGITAAPSDWTPEQRKQIETAKKLYYARLRQSSAAAIKRQKIENLRALAARLEADEDAAGA